MRKIKVLHMITELPVGGAQDNTLLTVSHLDKRKYDVTLLSSPAGSWVQRAQNIPGIRVLLEKSIQREIHLISDFVAFWKIYMHIRRERYDIVHTHSSKPGVLGRAASKLAGVPVVIHTIHGFPFNDYMNFFVRKFYIFLEKMASKWADKMITVSNLNLEKAVALRIAQREKFVNIYSGIDFDSFSIKTDVPQKRRELDIPPGHFVVGMVGRLSPQKAPQYFIQAAAHVLKDIPNVMFLLVGDGSLREELERLSYRLGLENHIRFLGERDDIPEILNVFDVFVLSSLWEGLGRALTEAMAMAKPTVATSVEGVPELVDNDKTGILVPPKDPESLGAGIQRLLRDKSFAAELGQNAQSRVLRDFSAEIMIERIDALYEQLLSHTGEWQ
ncbi:MAG: glycosyltransferase family 4 protein [Gemmatimonadota bacterium]|nr:MAG: glycosyltransferase family 4 protein [Gemmatimonadota bacterium]